MSQHQLYQKGSSPNKAKLKREQFFLGPEHGPGVCVYVRGLTRVEVDQHMAQIEDLKDKNKSESERKLAGYFLMACCLVDSEGAKMFDDAEDVERNFDVSASDFVKIMDVINRLSGLDKDRSKN
jgi:hypothetical protein